MKKIIFIVFLLLIVNNTSANLQTQNYINKVSNSIQLAINKTWVDYKNKIIFSLNRVLNKIKKKYY